MENYVNNAVEQFRTILEEQIARQRKMEKDNAYTDYKKLDKIIIGVCGGDGIGPIISAESVRVLEFILKKEIEAGKVEIRTIEGLTIENRIAHNQAIPDDVLAEIKACNVILKAPTTTLKDETTGESFTLVCSFTERQKAILKAGGLLSYTKEGK